MLDNLLPNLNSFSGVSKRGPPGSLLGPSMSWQQQAVHFFRMAPCFFLIPQMAAHCATFSSLLSVLAVCRGVTGHPMDARPQSFEGRHLFRVRCLMVSFTGSRLIEAESPLGLAPTAVINGTLCTQHWGRGRPAAEGTA